MLSDLKLQRLVRAAENLAEREAESGSPKRSTAPPLNATHAAPIVTYLLEPYETGYWELKAEWNPASRLAKYLLEKLGTTADLEKEAESVPFLATSLARKFTEDKRAELLRVTSRVSSINYLFKLAKLDENGDPPPKIPDLDAWVKQIDLSDLRREFSDAYSIFSQQIYFDAFVHNFINNRPYRTKAGLLTLLS
eukprot:gene9454-11606_t